MTLWHTLYTQKGWVSQYLNIHFTVVQIKGNSFYSFHFKNEILQKVTFILHKIYPKQHHYDVIWNDNKRLSNEFTRLNSKHSMWTNRSHDRNISYLKTNDKTSEKFSYYYHLPKFTWTTQFKMTV